MVARRRDRRDALPLPCDDVVPVCRRDEPSPVGAAHDEDAAAERDSGPSGARPGHRSDLLPPDGHGVEPERSRRRDAAGEIAAEHEDALRRGALEALDGRGHRVIDRDREVRGPIPSIGDRVVSLDVLRAAGAADGEDPAQLLGDRYRKLAPRRRDVRDTAPGRGRRSGHRSARGHR